MNLFIETMFGYSVTVKKIYGSIKTEDVKDSYSSTILNTMSVSEK